MQQILLLNGPNLALLGQREPEVYGTETLRDVVARVRAAIAEQAVLNDFQSNSEGKFIDRVHAAMHDGTDFIILNPGAWAHTSIALRDALLSVSKPFVEVHLSNVFAREAFRQRSYLSDIAVGVVSGLGVTGYELAATFALAYLINRKI